MIYRLTILVVLAFSVLSASAADRYRWEDAQGNVYYSDLPPPADARNIERTGVRDATTDDLLPYRLQVAVDKYPVTLYASDCGKPCDLARAFLVERGIPHTMRDPTQPKPREALQKLIGGTLEVPVAQVGKKLLRGFEAGQWNAALDAAGYPSAAMIEVTPTIPEADTLVPPDVQSEDETGSDADLAADSPDEDQSDDDVDEE